MKILVPTDFSENANNAMNFAKKLAHKNGSTITLLFAFYAVYDFAAHAEEVLVTIEEDAKKQLILATEAGEKEGLTIDYKIVQGTVATAVTSTAYREDYDLIIMGTQGAGGIKKALMGSNTGHVIKESKIPVLAIPAKSVWADTMTTVAIAVQDADEDIKNYTTLHNLTQGLDCQYKAFHINSGSQSSNSEELAAQVTRTFSQLFKHQANFKIIESKDFNDGIETYLDQNETSILVMFYRHKSFFEYLFNKSHSVEMAYHTHVPLLIIK